MLARTYQAARKAVKTNKFKKETTKSAFFETHQQDILTQSAAFEPKKYLASVHFCTLNTIDQNSLKNYLLTPIGAHAITSGYITIAEFLNCTISQRETLNRLLNPTYVVDADEHKKTIDHIFKNKYFTVDELKNTTSIQGEMLVRLLLNKNGLKLLDDGFLDKDQYLTKLDTAEQSALLKDLKAFSDLHLECHYHALINQISGRIAASSNSL